MKIGVVGCGTIGSEIAKAISENQIEGYSLAGIYDVNKNQSQKLFSHIKDTEIFYELDSLIDSSDIIFEATTKDFMPIVVQKTLVAGKSILAMSVGGAVGHSNFLDIAKKKNGKLYFPSGAICGIDGILAAKEAGLRRVQIETTKHPRSLAGSPYFINNKISADNFSKPVTIFKGSAREAIEAFPANTNVSITLSLAGLGIDQTEVLVIADPNCKRTKHEIVAEGDFGSIRAITEGVVSPSNPRTGYIAIVSAKATLKKIISGLNIGT